MTNPVLIEITRGGIVESRHRGAYVICDTRGGVVSSAGDIDSPTFPRSAVKALQALPLVEGGWADRLNLTQPELALACASHGGEPIHVETAQGLLGKAGRTVGDLECGVHWPTSKAAARRMLVAGGEPSALHNNCSGKHGGFLCLACGLEADPVGYVTPAHPVQQTIRTVLGELYGTDLSAEPGIDGCSIPTHAVALRRLAQAFARFGTGDRLGPHRAAAAGRLRAAVAAHPVMIAGQGFLDTRLAERFGLRVFTKTGAEGVFCAAFPELGFGLALKCDDGALRGSETLLLGLLAQIMAWTGDDRAAFADVFDPVLRNWNGLEVGRIRTTDAVAVNAPS